jgi:CheY-like chemotaxis protein
VLDQAKLYQEIREVLHHLYDYPYLETHPLSLRLWPVVSGAGPSRAQSLNRLMLECIEAINPPGEVSIDASPSRYYMLLVYRYVDERPMLEILRELGYSRSQYFREQQKAIMMLTSILADKIAITDISPVPIEHVLEGEVHPILGQREPVDPAKVMQGVLQAIHHLAEQHAVTLTDESGTDLPCIYTSRTLFRQVLLKSLSTLITLQDIREIRIRMRCVNQYLAVTILTCFESGTQSKGYPNPQMESVQRLVERMGGQWQPVETKGEICVWRFDLPVDNQKTLLVIEDNEGFIRVFQRYLVDYGYCVVGATTLDEALMLAHELLPAAFTLDIMMPNQDGWEILQALKDDPRTRSIPVIICSVLEDPDLAYSLGAAAYLQKPISQNDILRILNQICNSQSIVE